ncbi:PIG-X / PBN1 domain-containing protein [Ditylenchus destructor]|uniref:Phosphatidylinositol-glycan biosynthesis class X protein n=1 Tax=Ditylenchus destructor TaxID=166010 RepID=A0AAD4MZJ3_9BILA|nr:PIG-X / PBN1 domain-containing protein [Ditylenchus destructor]
MRKVFAFQDNLIFPIHLRYHVPIESEDGERLNNIVEINAPRVYLTCEYNKTFIDEPSCRRNIEKIPCHSSPQGKWPYFRLESRAINSKVSMFVPVGNKDHTIIVTISTVFIVFGCVVYLIRSLLTAKSGFSPQERTATIQSVDQSKKCARQKYAETSRVRKMLVYQLLIRMN